MKTTKRRFICVLSVAALSATMLTVPAYSEEPPADDGSIRVEGESYTAEDQKWDVHSTDVKPNIGAPPDNSGLNLTSGKVSFSEEDKPYAAYTFEVEKAGIYDLEYVANYLKDEAKDCRWLSPFSVTLNDDQIFFKDDTPNNDAMISYKAPAKAADNYGTYKFPVYLKQGENKITFTVEGGRYNGNPDYVFYLDYFQFTYNETATASDTIKVESEELIAGNVAKTNIAQLKNSAASGEVYYQFNNTTNEGGYLEYIVPASEAGEYQLTLAGNNTDYTPGLKGWVGDYTIVINDDEDSKISVGSEDGQSSDVKTETHLADTLDTMVSNKNVTLKQGLNKVKIRLDRAGNKTNNYVIHLDYLQFAPAIETSPTPTPADDGTIKVEGENYDTPADKDKWEFKTPADGQVSKSDKLGEPAHTGMVLNSKTNGTYSAENKPSAAYTFSVEKAGIYDLEYVTNYLKDETKDCRWLSPFSVTVNGDEVMFTGDTPNNASMTSYKAPSTSKNMFGTYKLPVYLDKGENNIKFTVEGGRYNGSEDYVFYLDYFAFTYNEDETKSDTVKAEAEELIAGNVPVVNIAQMSYDEATDKTYYRFTAGQNVSEGYLEYVIASPTEGKFRLELAGSNTDCEDNIKGYMGDYSIVINGDENSKISVGSPDKISSGVTSVSHNLIDGSGYDVMYSNVPVTLKKGLNKVKVRLDGAAGNGNHVIDLDYLKFTPAQDEEPSPTPTAPSGELEASEFTVSDKGIASAEISNNGSGPEAAAVISASYNEDGTLASVKLAQKTIGSGVTETVTTEALDKITSDVRAYVWSMYDHHPLNDSIVPITD